MAAIEVDSAKSRVRMLDLYAVLLVNVFRWEVF